MAGFLTRWDRIAEPQTDEWFAETAASVYLPEVYLQAAQMLVDEGLADEADFPFASDGYREATPGSDIIDRIGYDGHLPNAIAVHVANRNDG